MGTDLGEVERLQFELRAAKNELEIADGEIERQKTLDPFTPTEKRIEFLNLLKLVQKDGESPGDTILRALRALPDRDLTAAPIAQYIASHFLGVDADLAALKHAEAILAAVSRS